MRVEDTNVEEGCMKPISSHSIGLEIQPSVLLSNSSIVPQLLSHSAVAGVALWRHCGTLEIAVPQLDLVTHYDGEW